MPDVHVLDDPVGAALRGPQSGLAQRLGAALRFPPAVSPFTAPPADAAAWRDLASLVGPGGAAVMPTLHPEVPAGWTLEREMPGVQLVDEGAVAGAARPDPGAVDLGADDVPEMLALVERTNPGPFATRTVELGRYLGLRAGGRLVAMAGERLHPPGWVEISAVCTDADHRGRGLATRLVLAVAHGVVARGATPFLHTTAANTRAIRLYEDLGFRLRARPSFVLLRAPVEVTSPPVGSAPSSSSSP